MNAREPTQQTEMRRRPAAVKSMSSSIRSSLRSAFVENATLKLVAFMLALTVFFLVHSDKRAVVTLTVGVSYSRPAGKVLASRPPEEVRLTVRGSRRLIKRVDEREIERIHIDLPDINGEFVFQNDTVRLPAGLELVTINPASFPLRIERPTERSVPIEMRLEGSLPSGYEIVGRSIEPDKVLITGAESVVKRTSSVALRPLSLDGRVATFIEEVPLASPEEFIEISDEVQTARVRVQIGKKLGAKALGKQKITVVPGPGIDPSTAVKFTTEPSTVEVALSGPLLALEAVSDVTVEVRITAADLVPGIERKAPVVIRGLPEGVASEIRPQEVVLRVK